MDVAVYSDAHLGLGEDAPRVESAGFSHLWIYDSPLVFGEPYLAALEVLRRTSRLVVGPGVTHPGSRPAVATAQALATLAVAGPGRVACGLGTGSSARHSVGGRPASLAAVAAYARDVADLVAGRATADPAHPLQFLHPEGRWISVGEHVPIWISAFGPRGQCVAAAVADGIVVRWEGPEALHEVRRRIDDAACAAGRDPREVALGVLFAVYPLEDSGELEHAETRAALGPLVLSRLRHLTNTHADADEAPSRFRSAFTAYRQYRETLDPTSRHRENYRGYLTFTPPELERFVDPQAMLAVCLADHPERIGDELDRMAAAGADQVGLQIPGLPDIWTRRMGALLAERGYHSGHHKEAA